MYIASCSFGKDSIAQVILAHIHNEPLDLIVYAEVMFDKNTSAEIPEHRQFIYNVAIPKFREWGYKVQIVRSEKTFIDCFYQKIRKSKVPERVGKYMGFPLNGKCCINSYCKIKPIRDFYKNQEIKNVIQYIGIAADEQKRLERLDGKTKISLLEKYKFTEKDAKELCNKYSLLSPMYKYTNRGGVSFAKMQEKKNLEIYIKTIGNYGKN